MGDVQGELPQPVGQRPAAPQRRRWRRWLALGLGGAVLCLGAGAAGGYWLVQNIIAGLPPTPMLSAMPVSTEVVDRKGALLRAFTTADGR